jgi:outer membrane protein assembly factor BamB
MVRRIASCFSICLILGAAMAVASPQLAAAADGTAAFRGDAARTGVQSGPGPAGAPVVLWRARTGGAVRSTPAIVAGVVYVGSDDGTVYALDAASGAVRWRAWTGDPVVASPAVADGLVYIGAYAGENAGALFALDAASGAVRWAVRMPEGSPFASPVVVDGTVYAASTRQLYALDAATGAVRWSFAMFNQGGGGDVFPSPAVADGVVYVGGTRANVRELDAVDAVTGERHWRSQAVVNVATPAVADGKIFLATVDGLRALAVGDGKQIWSASVGTGAIASPAVANGIVYAVDDDGALVALDAATGQHRWRTAAATVDPRSSPVIAGTTIVVVAPDGAVRALDATGGEQWHVAAGQPRASVPGGVVAAPVVVDGVVYIGGTDGSITALGIGAPGGEIAAAAGPSATATVPDTPAGAAFAWLQDRYNAGGRLGAEEVQAHFTDGYLEQTPVDDLIAQVAAAFDAAGQLTVAAVGEVSTPDRLVVRLRDAVGRDHRLVLGVEAGGRHRIDELRFD